MTANQTGTTGRERLHIILPVLLVDEVLPKLKDTELRVLLIVLRQTRVAGKEAGRCWLTHRELCRRTGRASEAVSGAVEKLVDQGLLHVLDEAGKRLVTPAERQRLRERHFYCLPLFDNVKPLENSEQTDAGKSKTIEKHYKPYSFRKSEGMDSRTIESPTPTVKANIEQEKERIRERLRGISTLR